MADDEPKEWRVIHDNNVRHIWKDDAGVEHIVGPDFYQESGTPCDEYDDMEYMRTEILI